MTAWTLGWVNDCSIWGVQARNTTEAMSSRSPPRGRPLSGRPPIAVSQWAQSTVRSDLVLKRDILLYPVTPGRERLWACPGRTVGPPGLPAELF